MALGKDYEGQDCALARTLELIGERWTLLLIRDAFYGVRRYSDFLEHLEIPRAVLADRLQVLTEASVLEKRQYQDSPARFEYVLTAPGRELWLPIYSLAGWGVRHLNDNLPTRLYLHAECGRRLDRHGHCPGCGKAIAVKDIEVRPGPAADRSKTDRVSRALLRPHRLLTPLLP